ncbi:hypothetical protein BC940DRAFT_345460 [Gongronella butleri]|nr:hypothetical protein BC940DRAFT_345460 [Gongronella butleri]
MTLKRFDNQVAGHDKILQFSTHDLLVIKPCSDQERLFYEQSQQYDDFCEWIPECYGTLRQATDKEIKLLDASQDATAIQKLDNASSPEALANSPAGTPAVDQRLCLENIVSGFTRPCIIDIKLGFRIYEDSADDAKKAKMIKNARGTTIESLGLRISGMKVYHPHDHAYILYPKQYGRERTKDNFVQGLQSFFYPCHRWENDDDYDTDANVPRHCSKIPVDDDDNDETKARAVPLGKKKIEWIVDHCIDTVSDLRDFAATHPELHLTASSLLLVYEGDADAAQRVWKRYLDEDKQHDNDQHTATNGKSAQNGENGENGDDDDESDDAAPEPKLCDARLIDFARSRWEHGTRHAQDPSLLQALDNMIDMLQQVLDHPPK